MPHIFKLTLTPKSGLLSELHSDTILGHFCWRLKERYSERRLAEFIKQYRVKPVFTISNAILEKDFYAEEDIKKEVITHTELFFPKPLLPIPVPQKNARTKTENLMRLLTNKALKDKKYVPLNQLNLALQGKIEELRNEVLKTNDVHPKMEPDLRVSVEIDREKLTNKQGQLFSYYPKYPTEDTRVVLFVKIIDSDRYGEFNCEQVLKDVFETGYGKKKSSGYGEFESVLFGSNPFTGFEEPADANGFITLSNYLPAADDGITKESKYDYMVKYGRLGEERALAGNPFKKPIILFTPGSCFYTEKRNDGYGRVTNPGDISVSNEDAVQFGVAFTLKVKISD